MDVENSINENLIRADWRVNASANQSYSLGRMIRNVTGKFTANYWLSLVYMPEIAEAHCNGDIHIHDLYMLRGYCEDWSLPERLNSVPGKVETEQPMHMSSAVGQFMNSRGALQRRLSPQPGAAQGEDRSGHVVGPGAAVPGKAAVIGRHSVVLSGGEPTLQAALPDALKQVRAMGFAKALHTGDIYPGRLAAVLSLLDWVGLNIKSRSPAVRGIQRHPQQ